MVNLSPADMLKEWAADKARSVYCLAGEERTLKDEAVKKLLAARATDAFNTCEYDADNADINDMISAAMTPSLTPGTRLILLKGAEKLKKDPSTALAEYLQDPSDTASLIILLDKRTDAADLILKSLPPSAALINFEPLEGAQAAIFAKSRLEQEGIKASPEAIELLVEMAGSDATAMKQEIAKLAALMHGRPKQLQPEDVMESAGFSRTVNPFALSNAITAKNGPLACEIAEHMMAEGAEPVAITVSIAYIVEKLLRVKKSESMSGDASYALGLSPGYYRRLADSARVFQLERLSKSLSRCLEIEAMLKSSSGRDPKLLVKQLIFEITR